MATTNEVITFARKIENYFENIELLEERRENADYTVRWVDGKKLVTYDPMWHVAYEELKQFERLTFEYWDWKQLKITLQREDGSSAGSAVLVFDEDVYQSLLKTGSIKDQDLNLVYAYYNQHKIPALDCTGDLASAFLEVKEWLDCIDRPKVCVDWGTWMFGSNMQYLLGAEFAFPSQHKPIPRSWNVPKKCARHTEEQHEQYRRRLKEFELRNRYYPLEEEEVPMEVDVLFEEGAGIAKPKKTIARRFKTRVEEMMKIMGLDRWEAEFAFFREMKETLPKKNIKRWVLDRIGSPSGIKTFSTLSSLDSVEAVRDKEGNIIATKRLKNFVPLIQSKTYRGNPNHALMRAHRKKCSDHRWEYCHFNPDAKCHAVCHSCRFYLPTRIPYDVDIPEIQGLLDIGADKDTKDRMDKLMNLLTAVSVQTDENVNKIIGAFQQTATGLDKSMQDSVKAFTHTIKELSDTAKHLHSKGVKFTLDFPHFKNQKQSSSPVKLVYDYAPALLNLAILCFVDMRIPVKVILAIPSMQILLKALPFELTDIFSFVTNLFSNKEDLEDILPSDTPVIEGPALFEDGGVGPLFRVLSLMCGISYSKKDFLYQNMVDGFLRRTALLGRSMSTGSVIIEKIKIAFISFSNFLLTRFGFEPIFLDEYSKTLRPFMSLTDKLLATQVDYSNVDEAWVEQIFEAYRLGLHISKELASCHCPSSVLSALGVRLTQLARIKDKCELLGSISRPRSPPLFVYLWGPSGVGKSTCINSLQVDLAKIDKDTSPEDWCKNIYLRIPENEYADGARNGTFVEFYDEFGQLHDTITTPDPSYLEILRLGNIIPFPRHMAEAHDKGKVFARPRIVFATSNLALSSKYDTQDHLVLKSIKCVEAFERRWDIVAKVTVDETVVPAAASGDKIAAARALSDYQREFRDRTGEPIDLNVYNFAFEYKGVQRVAKYNEFVNVVAHEYRLRQTQSEGYVNYLNDYAKKPFPTANVDYIPNIEGPVVPCVPDEGEIHPLVEGLLEDMQNVSPCELSPEMSPNEVLQAIAASKKKILTVDELLLKYKNPKLIVDIDDFRFVRFHNGSGMEVKEYKPHEGNDCHKLYILLMLRNVGRLTPAQQVELSNFGKIDTVAMEENMQFYFELLKYLKSGKPLVDGLEEVQDLYDTIVCSRPGKLRKVVSFLTFFPARGLVQELLFLSFLKRLLKKKPEIKEILNTAFGNPHGNDIKSYQYFFDYLVLNGINIASLAQKAKVSSKFVEAARKYTSGSKLEPLEFSTTIGQYYRDMAKVHYFFFTEFLDKISYEHEPVKESGWRKMLSEVINNGWGVAAKIPGPARLVVMISLLLAGTYSIYKFYTAGLKLAFDFIWNIIQEAVDYFSTPKTQSLHRGGLNYRKVATESLTRGGLAPHRVRTEGFEIPAIQSLTDNNAFSYCIKAEKNARILKTGFDRKMERNGIFVKGRIFLTYKHTFHVFAAVAEQCGFVDIHDAHDNFIVSVPWSSVDFAFDKTDEFADRMLLSFPRTVPAAADITKAFITLDQIEKVGGERVALVVPSKSTSSQPHFKSVCVQTSLCRYVKNDIYNDTCLNVTCHADLYQYECQTVVGDCGSVLVSLNSNLCSQKICGLHVAALKTKTKRVEYGDKELDNRVYYNGRAAIVTIEHLENMMQELSPVDGKFSVNLEVEELNIEVPETEAEINRQLPFEGNFHQLARIKKPVPIEWSTCLIETPCSGIIQTTKVKPAHLKAVTVGGEKVYPIYKSIIKSGNVPPMLDYEVLKVASSIVANRIINASELLPFQLTTEQAIHGLPGTGLLSSLTTTTSPGYPYCLMRESQKGGKKTWIDFEKDFVSRQLIENSEKFYQDALNGIRNPVVWMDFAKDETRPVEKVDALKTRSINCSPLMFTIMCRRMYGAFCAAVTDGKIRNGIAIGVNPYSFEWTDLALHLKEVGNLMIAGDFGGWDGGLTSELMWAAFDVMEEWYRSDYGPTLTEDQQREQVGRRVLFEDIVHSIHVVGSDVYQWSHGMPSGTFLTAFLNSIINQLIFTYFLLINNVSCSEIVKSFRCIVLGDDHIYSVSPRFQQFNQEEFKLFVQSLGMTYTDENKTDAIHRFRKLEEVTFLKRGFTWSSNLERWMAPLAFDSIAEMLNWVRNKIPLPVALNLNVQCVARELTMYDVGTYTSVLEKVCSKLRKLKIKYDYIPPYFYLQKDVIEGSKWPYDV